MPKKLLRNRTEYKNRLGAPSAQPADLTTHPGAHRRAQACARMPCRRPLRPYRGHGPRPYRSPSGHVAAHTRAPCPASLRSLPRAPARLAMSCRGRSGRIVVECCAPSLAVSWLGWPCRKTPQLASPPSAYHNTLSVLQYNPYHSSPSYSQYTNCIAIQFQQTSLLSLAIQFTHCTPKLQYTSLIAIQFSSSHYTLLAIQFFPIAIHLPSLSRAMSRYNSLSHNTIGQ